LLLDEATSALDTASEAVVQDALDKAMEGGSYDVLYVFLNIFYCFLMCL